MPIGRVRRMVIDCLDPSGPAAFYSEVLGLLGGGGAPSGIAFQFAPDHVPPSWPDPARPQRLAVDVMVDDLAAAVVARAAAAAGRPRLRRSGRPPVLPDRPTWLGSPGAAVPS